MEIYLNDVDKYNELFNAYAKKKDIILLKSKLILNYIFYIKKILYTFNNLINNLLPIKSCLLYNKVYEHINSLIFKIDLLKKTDDSIILETSYQYILEYSNTIKKLYKSFILNDNNCFFNKDFDKLIVLFKEFNIDKNYKSVTDDLDTNKNQYLIDFLENLKKKLLDNNLELKENIITHIVNNKKHDNNEINLIASALIMSLKNKDNILNKEFILSYIYQKIKNYDIKLYDNNNEKVMQIKTIIDKMIDDIFYMLNNENKNIDIEKDIKFLNTTFNLNVEIDKLIDLIYNYCDILIFYKKLFTNDLKDIIKSIYYLLIISERYNDLELYI